MPNPPPHGSSSTHGTVPHASASAEAEVPPAAVEGRRPRSNSLGSLGAQSAGGGSLASASLPGVAGQDVEHLGGELDELFGFLS
jgi:hypothetical protein